ncbi:metaxin-2 [Drosophila bipectinata]|uniref:metaxin-2 n=1 Tax=Drosophila bipectinata TaxID=42026 RepID=UPI001C895C91|nr:metaxin-2 [Drosophila bipectinata]
MNSNPRMAASWRSASQAKDQDENAWPKDAQLHQPPEKTQLLLAERASCLAVKTYLLLCGLPFQERTSDHAEFMSPGGRLTRLPLLRIGLVRVLSEFGPIVDHVEATQTGHCLDAWLTEEQRDEMHCLVNYVENVFSLAEIHFSFVDTLNYQLYTGPRSGAAHPWPLCLIRRYAKQREATRLLKVYQWESLDPDQVLHEVSSCCSALVSKLEENETGSRFFFGPRPCQLDALVFGHVAAILSTWMPNMEMADLLYGFPRIIGHCRRLDNSLFQGRLLAEENEDLLDGEEEWGAAEQHKQN